MIQCLIRTFTQNITDCFIYFHKCKQFLLSPKQEKKARCECSDLPVTKIIFVRALPYLTGVKRNIFIFPTKTINYTNMHTHIHKTTATKECDIS